MIECDIIGLLLMIWLIYFLRIDGEIEPPLCQLQMLECTFPCNRLRVQ